MLKANFRARLLVQLFHQVWNEEKVPEARKKGIIIKLPKKGYLGQCSNWRGINQPVVSTRENLLPCSPPANQTGNTEATEREAGQIQKWKVVH